MRQVSKCGNRSCKLWSSRDLQFLDATANGRTFQQCSTRRICKACRILAYLRKMQPFQLSTVDEKAKPVSMRIIFPKSLTKHTYMHHISYIIYMETRRERQNFLDTHEPIYIYMYIRLIYDIYIYMYVCVCVRYMIQYKFSSPRPTVHQATKTTKSLFDGSSQSNWLPSRELTYPTLGKGQIIIESAFGMGYVSSQ